MSDHDFAWMIASRGIEEGMRIGSCEILVKPSVVDATERLAKLIREYGDSRFQLGRKAGEFQATQVPV